MHSACTHNTFTFLGGHEADQGGGHTPSPEVGGDPKVQDGDDLIPERGVEGQGARPKPGICVQYRQRQQPQFLRPQCYASYYNIGVVSGGS